MTNVTNALQERIEQRKTVETFMRLSGIAKKSREELLADPYPHMERISREIAHIRHFLEQVEHALSGNFSMMNANNQVLSYKSMEANMHQRITLAQSLIWRALEPPT